jgi:succinate-semialdehyde dehydrogenase/glutarate-semialdehyde dehydrogenase
MSQRNLHTIIQNMDLVQTQGYINGNWCNAKSNNVYVLQDPASEKEIAKVAAMGVEETNDAIDAAALAFKEWSKKPASERSSILQKWSTAIRSNAEDLAKITCRESGKVIAQAMTEVLTSAGSIEYYAHECLNPTAGGFIVPGPANHRMMVTKQPVGVCGIITPWNFPILLIARKLGPCLASGCTAVLKPASETPLSALALAKLGQDAGLPPGVLNIVPTSFENTPVIGNILSTHKTIRKLSFTGSTGVGKMLMGQAAGTMKKLSLELGGNAPFIIFADADLEAAASGLVASKFEHTGQTCICSNRIFVEDKIVDEFTNLLVKKVKALKQGPPMENNIDLGPLISERALKKVRNIVDDAVEKGAKVLVGGAPATDLGSNFYQATVLTNINKSMRIWDEEIFGPVVPIFSFATEDEVIQIANSTDVGLAGYFYTTNHKRAWRVARALEVGMVGVNTVIVTDIQAPFGGIKESGLGREGSLMGLEEFLDTKMISMGGLD